MNIRKSITIKNLLILVYIVMLSACTTLDSSYFAQQVNRGSISSTTTKQQLIVDSALDSVNKKYKKTLTFNNKKFTNDCSGLIYGIFWAADIDLISATSSESGNGVKRLYKVLDRENLIHKEKLPNPGDLIFWSNTYGSWGNNPLSHVGVVVSVDENTGQIDYVHNNTYLGAIRKETMNLFTPHENRPINNYMRYDSKYKKTAAELFESFGMAWDL